jgi:hypothetical protein
MGLLLGNPLKRSIVKFMTILTTFHHYSTISLSLGILGFIDPRRGCPSFYGKKGMKVQRD